MHSRVHTSLQCDFPVQYHPALYHFNGMAGPVLSDNSRNIRESLNAVR